jgi:hypothetical protein
VTAIIYPAAGGITTKSVPLSTLEGGQCPTYTGPSIELYRQDGTLAPAQTYTTAWSVGTVLGCMKLTGVLKILVEQSGAPELSRNSQLFPNDLTYPNPSDFVNPSEAPLIYSDGSGIGYVRPWRGQGDANAPDVAYDQYPAAFQFEVFQRTVLQATVTPSPGSVVPVGATVTFTAQAPGMGQGLSYSWDFGGAAPSSTGPSASVTYTSAGTYDVTVQVTDSAGNVSQSNALPIQVGSAPPTSQNPSAPPTGPTKSHGHTPGGHQGNKNKSGTTTGKGHKPGTGRHGHAKAVSHATTPSSGGTSNGSGPSGSGSSAAGTTTAGRGHTPRAGGRARKPPKRRATSTIGAASLVTGRLVSDVIPLSAVRSPLVHAVPAALATAPAAHRVVSASLLPALAAGLGVFLLFSLGAGRELRWLRPWRLLHFGS